MDSNIPWDPSPSSGLPANNPFLESSAANRYPALDAAQSYQSTPYPSQSLSSSPSQFQQQSPFGPQSQHLPWSGSSQLQSPSGPGPYTNYGVPQQQAQPTGYASFGAGQQFSQQPAYGTQPQLQSQLTGYPQFRDTTVAPQYYQQYPQNAVAEFDPLNGAVNGQNQNQGGTIAPSTNPQKTGPSGQPHPRQFIHSHKVELESWNAAIWTQALLTFEELKRSWERRRVELQRHLISGQYLSAEDIAQVNGMIRNSESNIDSVTASLIQMQEVNSGYKHSLDAAGKRRVKEALNAGLQYLPEWP